MAALIGILMYLGLLAPSQNASPAQINSLANANQAQIVAVQGPILNGSPIIDPSEQN
jgi:hypothetical protein